MFKVMVINNSGAGVPKYEDVDEGTTLSSLLEREGGNRDSFTIRVNNQSVAFDHVLKEGDRVVMTPNNIEGA